MVDADTLVLLRSSLLEVLTAGDGIGEALLELGWDDVVSDDPAVATTCLFEVQGEVRAVTDQVDVVAAAAAGLPAGTRFVWPDPGAGAGVPSSTIAGARVEVRGLVTAGFDVAAAPSVAVPTDQGLVLVDPSTLVAAAVLGVDPDAGWSRVTGDAGSLGSPCPGWDAGLAAARRAVASELIGACTGMLGLATAHVTSREQFGRPIGSYQSVRHRLAEAFANVEGARATVAAAWQDGGPVAAEVAKAVAGRAHADVARHCLQVCGAMGLTWEFDLHRFVRRGQALDAFIGSSRQLARTHGQALLAGTPLARVGSPVPA